LLAAAGLVASTTVTATSLVQMQRVRGESLTDTRLGSVNVVLVNLDMQQSNVQIAERDSLLATTDASRRAAVASLSRAGRRRDCPRRGRDRQAADELAQLAVRADRLVETFRY
jgi:hypothetical protein